MIFVTPLPDCNLHFDKAGDLNHSTEKLLPPPPFGSQSLRTAKRLWEL